MRRIGADERRARLARRHHLAVDARARGFVELAVSRRPPRHRSCIRLTWPCRRVWRTQRRPDRARAVRGAARPADARHATDDVRRAAWSSRRSSRPRAPTRSPSAASALRADARGGGIASDGPAGSTRSAVSAGGARGSWRGVREGTVQGRPSTPGEDRVRRRQAWAGSMGVTTMALFLLAADGRIVRGRPRGTWTSSSTAGCRRTRWFPAPLPDLGRDGGAGGARPALARRRSGRERRPTCAGGRARTLAPVRAALAALEPVEVDLDGTTGYRRSRDDTEPTASPEPWAALLPALDPTTMGWKERDWYLGEHGPRSSTRPATPARPSGGTGASSAAGRSDRTARSSSACSRTSARTRVAGDRGGGGAPRSLARRDERRPPLRDAARPRARGVTVPRAG